MSDRKVKPTSAQARRLAVWWGDDRLVQIGGYIEPTTAAILKRGWLSPTATGGTYPSGQPFENYRVNQAGVDALLGYLLAAYHKREGVAP